MRPDKPALVGSALFALLLALVLIGPRLGSLRGLVGRAGPNVPQVRRDLRDIRRDTLRVLVIDDPLTWECVEGQEPGTEWELLERFARQAGLAMKALPVNHPDTMLSMLQRGAGDIMAAQLNPGGWARGMVLFSRPYRMVAPVRLSLKRDPLVPKAPPGTRRSGVMDTLALPLFSPFTDMPQVLDSTAGPALLEQVPRLPRELVVDVALGRCPVALVSDAQCLLVARRFPHVRCDARIGPSVPLVFAVRSNSPRLLNALNAHLATAREQEALRMFIAAQNTGRRGQGSIRSLPEIAFVTDSISPFDSLFQAHAEQGALDWRLVAALAFKESRFDTSALSQAGAQGLMQMMPSTLERLGHDTANGVGGTIQAATRYLAQLDTLWRASVPDREQRRKFVLAAYNAGPGHIKDAQRLAERYGLDPRRWDGSVERTVLLLSDAHYHTLPEVKNGYCRGHETFWHVRDVIGAFHQFRAKAAP